MGHGSARGHGELPEVEGRPVFVRTPESTGPTFFPWWL